jgi:hypothetical protein
MVKYKGFKVKAGVKWKVTKTSVTITSYPKKSSVAYKLYTKSWKNYCPSCKRSGYMVGFGTGRLSNGRGKFGVEGGVACLKCDSDFCSVTGRDTKIGSKRKMTPAASVVSKVNASESSVAAAKCELTQAEALAGSKTILNANNKSKYKGTLTVPMLSKFKPEQYCQLELERFKDNRKNIFWVDSVKVDINNQTMAAELLESMPVPDQEYKNDSNDSNVTTTSTAIAIKADTAIERTIMLKGKELGTVDKIYKWLRVRGVGNWSYSFYYNHWKNKGSCMNKSTSAMKICWKKRRANCTDVAWIFYTMCLGIGVKVRIIHGTAKFGSGSTFGHLWNKYNGKIYDCSSSSASNYNPDKVVK